MKDKPTAQEVQKWLLSTATHAYHIEYFLQRLQVGLDDPDRPHDIMNVGNKFDWEAIKGFSLQYRENGPIDFHNEIMAARQYHRQQHHHKMWGKFYPDASEDAMMLGAVDTVCSMLEPREYQNGCHTYSEIHAKASKNPIHKVAWMKLAAVQMERIQQVPLHEIISFSTIPRIGITAESYDTIIGRVEQTLKELKNGHGYKI
jgi:hypothetical protein